MSVQAAAKAKAKAEAYLNHPMAHADNRGLDYAGLMAGTVQAMKPVNPVVPADPADKAYMNEWFKDKGEILSWIRKDAMGGTLVKKHKISCGLVEEWSPLVTTLVCLTAADTKSCLTCCAPNMFTEETWKHFALWGDKEMRPAIFYETSTNTDTMIAHTLKQMTRTCIIERAMAARERHPYKYEWQLQGVDTVPSVEDVEKHLQMQSWGKYRHGAHPHVPASSHFGKNVVWITASLNGPNILFIEIGDIDPQDPQIEQCVFSFTSNYCAENTLKMFDPNMKEIGSYELYRRFKVKYGEQLLHTYLPPSPRNPNLGQDPTSVPATVAWRIAPKSSASAANAAPKPTLSAARSCTCAIRAGS